MDSVGVFFINRNWSSTVFDMKKWDHDLTVRRKVTKEEWEDTKVIVNSDVCEVVLTRLSCALSYSFSIVVISRLCKWRCLLSFWRRHFYWEQLIFVIDVKGNLVVFSHSLFYVATSMYTVLLRVCVRFRKIILPLKNTVSSLDQTIKAQNQCFSISHVDLVSQMCKIIDRNDCSSMYSCLIFPYVSHTVSHTICNLRIVSLICNRN